MDQESKRNNLIDLRRGTLSDSNSDNIMDTVSTPNSLAGSQMTWGLDAVGNWDSTTTDGGAAVNRDHNAQNQLEDLDTGSGSGGRSFDDNAQHHRRSRWPDADRRPMQPAPEPAQPMTRFCRPDSP